MAVEVQKNHVTVAGLRTYYWQAGTGPVLLMLHGQLPGSCVAVEWGDQVRRFGEAGFSVYAPDVPGFGQTDNPPDFSIGVRIAHARAFADHFGFTRYSIWGSSMGSYMACALALDDPRVHKLVLNPSTILPPHLPGVTACATPRAGHRGGGPARSLRPRSKTPGSQARLEKSRRSPTSWSGTSTRIGMTRTKRPIADAWR